MSYSYVVRLKRLDPNTYVPLQVRVDADSFERDGDTLIFYRDGEPVAAFSLEYLIQVERS